MKRLKKLSKMVTCVLVMCATMVLPVYAQDTADSMYEYVDIDGSVIEYYLDEEGNPYHYVNDEKIYLALPLEHLRVTDPEKIEELNQILADTMSRAVPTSYVDLSTGAATLASNKYTASVSFANATSFTTQVLKFHSQHKTIRIETSDIVKENIFAGKKVTIVYHYYDLIFDEWSEQKYTSKDCSDIGGFGIQYVGSTSPYARFDIEKSSAIESFTLKIWTTPLYD